MTLAITAVPLNRARRDMSVSGTRAVVSSQQLMRASEIRTPGLTVSRGAAHLGAVRGEHMSLRSSLQQLVRTATFRSASLLDGCSSGEYARMGLPVQCIVLLISYADWR